MTDAEWRKLTRWKTSAAKRLYEEAERARESEAGLLEALKLLAESMADRDDLNTLERSDLERARAAIAKAGVLP